MPRQALGSEPTVQVGDPKDTGEIAESAQQSPPAQHIPELSGLQFGDAGEKDVLQTTGIVDEGYVPMASAGEAAGGVKHAL